MKGLMVVICLLFFYKEIKQWESLLFYNGLKIIIINVKYFKWFLNDACPIIIKNYYNQNVLR